MAIRRNRVDQRRLWGRWLFELSEGVTRVADRLESERLSDWAGRLRLQLGEWAVGGVSGEPSQLDGVPGGLDVLDEWLVLRLVRSASAGDAVLGLMMLGWTSQQIANAHGDVSDNAVQGYVQRVSGGSFVGVDVDQSFVVAVRAAHAGGLGPRWIAARVGVSRKLVERLVA